MPGSHYQSGRGYHRGHYIGQAARSLQAIRPDTYGELAERDKDFIALLSPLCATGEYSIKVCGLIKFSAAQLKRQLVHAAYLHRRLRGAGGP